MKINILFTALIYVLNFSALPQAFSFEPDKLKGDLKFIEENFLKDHQENKTQKLSSLENKNDSSKITNLKVIDLEEKYFDKISTKNAAPTKENKEKIIKRRAR